MTFKFEKRAHPRVSFGLQGTIEVLNRRTFAAAQAPARVVNVGGGGLALTLDAELSMGDLIRVTLKPARESEALVFNAQVMWIRRNAMRLLGACSAGLEFRPVAQAGAARLVRAALATRTLADEDSFRPAPALAGQEDRT